MGCKWARFSFIFIRQSEMEDNQRLKKERNGVRLRGRRGEGQRMKVKNRRKKRAQSVHIADLTNKI